MQRCELLLDILVFFNRFGQIGFIATSFICAFTSIVIGTITFVLGLYSLTKK